MASVAFYIQRVSDGKYLRGDGPISPQGFLPFNPNSAASWVTVGGAGVPLNEVYWIITGTSYSSQESAISQIIDQMPASDGDWNRVMYRVYPLYSPGI